MREEGRVCLKGERGVGGAIRKGSYVPGVRGYIGFILGGDRIQTAVKHK